MRNSPEPNDFRELENRLRNYSEQPDESVWTSIANGIKPPENARGAVLRDWSAGISLILFLTWTLYTAIPDSGARELKTKAEQQPEIPEYKNAQPGGDGPAQTVEKSLVNADLPAHSAAGLVRKDTTTAAQAPPVMHNSAETGFSNAAHPVNEFSTPPPDSSDVQRDTAAEMEVKKITPVKKMDMPREAAERKTATFYAMLTPSLSFFYATPKSKDNIVVQDFESPSIFSSDRFGLSLEGGLQGSLMEKLNYTAGVSLYYQAQRLRYTGTFPEGSSIEDLGDFTYILSPGVFHQSINYTMLNAGLQGGLLYTLKDHLLKHQIGVVGQYQKGLYQSSSPEIYNNASSQYVFVQAVYRIALKRNSRINYFIQPTVGATVWMREALHGPFTLKSYRAGIGFGLTYLLHPAKRLKTLAPNQSNR